MTLRTVFGKVQKGLRSLVYVAVVLVPGSAKPRQQELPILPAPVYQELRERFYMDDAMELLGTPRSRAGMHEYLSMPPRAMFFLIGQGGGDVMTDEFRPSDSSKSSIQSLTLTIETADETLRMVHVLLDPESESDARRLIDGALQSADQGGARETKLHLLGVQEVDGIPYQVLLREETSSTGARMYWIHFF